MRQAAHDYFIEFSTVFEGCIPWMYADVKNLITVAIGNLVDSSPQSTPWKPAIDLPFVRPDGGLATPQEITQAWLAVKGDPKAAKYGYKYAQKIPGNQLKLLDAGIKDVVFAKLDWNDQYLSRRFPEFADWPADAQLATHSMAWALGVAFNFPLLEAALKARDFDGAAMQCTIRTVGNPGVIPRNDANKRLYSNASRSVAFGLDPERLFYPTALTDDPPAEPA